MLLIEITHAYERLDDDQRAQLAEAIVSGFLIGASDEATASATGRFARTLHVVFHEARGWSNGSGPLAADGPAPYLVTITVPEAWREETSRHAIAAVRTAIARLHPEHAAADDSGTVWINVVGVQDGSIGFNGKPSTAADLVRDLTQDTAVEADDELPDGVVRDPVCGMKVRLTSNAITVEHDGSTVGFCATGCRSVYCEDHGLADPLTAA